MMKFLDYVLNVLIKTECHVLCMAEKLMLFFFEVFGDVERESRCHQ